MRVQLKTLGCRLNEAELERWALEFQAEGHQVVPEGADADLLVLNSCAVTQDAVRKSRNQIRKATRENPGARVIVSGCYVSLHPSEAETLGIDLVVANKDKDRLVEIVQEQLAIHAMPAAAKGPEANALFQLGRHRAFVKVQDGCRHRCTYCIVTVARGEERSRTVEAIIDEINQHHQAGLVEVVLTGVHLGGYGSDLGCTLTDLIEAILARTSIPRIRLGSLEPWDIPPHFFSLFQNQRLMPHLHLPIQSGSASVLKRMARRSGPDDIRDLLHRLRETLPEINLTTDVIVGFPGETDEEWQETLTFFERMAFSHVHVFSFSPRQGTAAAHFSDPVDSRVRQARVHALMALGETLKQRYAQRFIGQTLPVLFEGARALSETLSVVQGYTPNYLKVALKTTPAHAQALSFKVHPTTLMMLSEETGVIEGRLPPVMQ